MPPREQNKYLDPEEEKKAESSLAEENARFEAENRRNIYWAPASSFQIANFQKEVKSGGVLVQVEKPIRFSENIFVTSDQKEIAFIESSESFKNGVVKKCQTEKEAITLNRQLAAMKGVRTIHVQDVTSTKIQEKV